MARPNVMQVTQRILMALKVRPRLIVALAAALMFGLFWPGETEARPVTRWIVAWNVGAWLYLSMVARMMLTEPLAQIHRRAKTQDDGAHIILLLVGMASVTSLGAIVAELSIAKDLHGVDKLEHVGLAVATIASSWAFTQVMFALHYAHDYYVAIGRQAKPGLSFPDTNEPNYMDFMYFSVVIGTSGQTADVAFSSSPMRRVGMLHCTLAFIFNTSMVGLMINVASSLV